MLASEICAVRHTRGPGGGSRSGRRATEALAAGISIFELARVMGTSVEMIDRTYGHLARDSDDAIRARLNARAARSGDEMATEGE